MAAGMTAMMIKAWIEAVMKPMAKKWVQEGLPLEQLGSILLGFSVSVLKNANWSADEVIVFVSRIARGETPPD